MFGCKRYIAPNFGFMNPKKIYLKQTDGNLLDFLKATVNL